MHLSEVVASFWSPSVWCQHGSDCSVSLATLVSVLNSSHCDGSLVVSHCF